PRRLRVSRNLPPGTARDETGALAASHHRGRDDSVRRSTAGTNLAGPRAGIGRLRALPRRPGVRLPACRRGRRRRAGHYGRGARRRSSRLHTAPDLSPAPPELPDAALRAPPRRGQRTGREAIQADLRRSDRPTAAAAVVDRRPRLPWPAPA